MLDDLKALEARLPKDAPRLVVISSGDAESNRVMELEAIILLDQGFTAGRAFGAGGTPSAIRLDANGRIATNVAIGAEPVLTLIAGENATPPVRRIDFKPQVVRSDGEDLVYMNQG
jgi:hypothetical protein